VYLGRPHCSFFRPYIAVFCYRPSAARSCQGSGTDVGTGVPVAAGVRRTGAGSFSLGASRRPSGGNDRRCVTRSRQKDRKGAVPSALIGRLTVELEVPAPLIEWTAKPVSAAVLVQLRPIGSEALLGGLTASVPPDTPQPVVAGASGSLGPGVGLVSEPKA